MYRVSYKSGKQKAETSVVSQHSTHILQCKTQQGEGETKTARIHVVQTPSGRRNGVHECSGAGARAIGGEVRYPSETKMNDQPTFGNVGKEMKAGIG